VLIRFLGCVPPDCGIDVIFGCIPLGCDFNIILGVFLQAATLIQFFWVRPARLQRWYDSLGVSLQAMTLISFWACPSRLRRWYYFGYAPPGWGIDIIFGCILSHGGVYITYHLGVFLHPEEDILNDSVSRTPTCHEVLIFEVLYSFFSIFSLRLLSRA